MFTRAFLWILLFVFLGNSTTTHAQILKKIKDKLSLPENKEEEEEPEGNIFELETFKPEQKRSTLHAPELKFPNINRLRYYDDRDKLDYINSYYRDKDWQVVYNQLLQYVNEFGIENFNKDAKLIELLGRAAREVGRDSVSRESYRLFMKHYRGNGAQARKTYDNLTKNKRFRYIETEKYFDLINRWQLVDSLRPSEDMGTKSLNYVNSEFEDYGATLAKNDSILFFTTKRSILDTGRKRGIGPENVENIYFAEKNEYGEWDNPQPFKEINSPYNEGSPCMSPDGKMFIMSRCNSDLGFGNCDLFVSYWDEETDAWSLPENMGATINSAQWDSHPSLSPNGDTLFFSSSRVTSFGGADLYYSVKDEEGQWGVAQNMGPHINTNRNEVSPYMHPLEHTLYFSSDGQLVNFGSFDIFKTHQIGRYWQEPKNVGPFINTEGSEFYFTITQDASEMFYARAEHNEKYQTLYQEDGNSDLFSFSLAMGGHPAAVVEFSGRFTEPTTGETFEGVIALFDIKDKIPIEPKYIREDGTFEFELIDDRDYLMIVSGENFFRLEEVFHLKGDTRIERSLKSIKTVQFESIEFASGSAMILPQMENDLHLLVSFLVEHPGYYLRVMGHTDTAGDEGENFKLSQKRAESIRRYILAYGEIDSRRVSALGFGPSYPLITPERNEEDRRINRRVEFRLTTDETALDSKEYKPEELEGDTMPPDPELSGDAVDDW